MPVGLRLLHFGARTVIPVRVAMAAQAAVVPHLASVARVAMAARAAMAVQANIVIRMESLPLGSGLRVILVVMARPGTPVVQWAQSLS